MTTDVAIRPEHAELYQRWEGLWGRTRRPWQLQALDLTVRTKGITGLFLDPGLGKTAVVFDYLTMLACAPDASLPLEPDAVVRARINGANGLTTARPTRLRGWDGAREVRVLVVAPPSGCDTWVRQSVQWMPPWVGVWGEVLGGSGVQRALTMGTRAVPWTPPSAQDPARFAGTPEREKQVRSGLSRWWGKNKTWTPGLHLATQLVARPAEQYTGPDADVYTDQAWGPDKGKFLGQPTTWFPPEWHDAVCSAGPSAVSNPWAVENRGSTETRPRVTMLVIPMPTLSNTTRADWLRGLWNQALQSFAPEVLVIDESHMIKGWDTAINMACENIARKTPRRLLLSGTPMPRSILDFGGQWKVLAPNDFREAGPGPATVFARDSRTMQPTLDETRFARRYSVEGYGVVPQPNPETIDELSTIIRARSIRVTKDELPEGSLPPITHNRVYVQLSPAERAVYDQATTRRNIALEAGDENQVRAAGTYMRMAVCGLVSEQPTVDGKPVSCKHTLPSQALTIGSTKADAAAELATTTLAGEKRLVVFSEFKGDLDQVCDALERTNRKLDGRLPIRVLRIDGEVKYEQRIAIRQQFGAQPTDQDDERLVLVAQISTMSTSVNELVTASHGIWTGITWNRVDWQQSADRLHRQGQENPVTCWQILADHSVDDEVLSSHERKESVEDAVTNATRRRA